MESSPNALFFVTQIRILLLLLLLVLTPIVSGQFTFDYTACNGSPYTANSTYQSNLNIVLNSLSSDTRITYGFYNFTSGQTQDPNRVSSLAICRGDVPLGTCRVCIKNAAKLLPQVCNKLEAFGYSQYCTIYVSNGSISGPITDFQNFRLVDQFPNVSNFSGFNRSLQGLLGTLVNRAASGGGQRKYAAGQANLTGDSAGNKVYALLQCTPDLNKSGCVECLQHTLSALPDCCVRPDFTSPGVKIAGPSCFAQYTYGVSAFYGNVPDSPLPPPPRLLPPTARGMSSPVPGRHKSSNAIRIAISISIVGLSLFIITALIWIILLRRKKLRKSWTRFSQEEIDNLESLQFSFGDIKHATENFKDDKKLGQGGFGIVYKGVLSNGSEIAVKRLSRSSGREGDKQFKNEILILAKLKHKNLVKLLGFCLHEEEMLLVYEVVANGSLDKFLFDPIGRESLMWETRFKIINGTARGIVYLHEESRLRIIHRDLKAANILLDVEFNPQIADFGMARLFNIDQTRTMTSKIVGTLGYMPPEYLFSGQVSMKFDVFSFGVLLLEIISGRKMSSSVDGENGEDLLSFAWRNWMEGTAWNLVDATLSTGFSIEILRCIHIGLLCVQENPVDRPTMSSVGLMLSSYTLALPVPSPPAFYMEGDSRPSAALQGNKTNNTSPIHSVNNVTISEFFPR